MSTAVVGRSVPRLDAYAKVTGTALYAGDLRIPGMLHGVIVRSTAPHARIRAIHTHEAEQIPGVVAILTGGDVADIDPYYGHGVKDRPLIALDKVRYVGEPVAAIAATDARAAAEARDRVRVEYETLPAVLDVEQALAPGAPLVHETAYSPGGLADRTQAEAGRPNICYQETYTRGDPNRGFTAADVVFEDTFTFPMVYHYAMEPYTVIASAGADGITVWASAQHPFLVRADLATMFREPLERVRIVVPFVGGGYGSKSYTKFEPLVVALSRKAGRPVRVACSVEEAMVTNRRHKARIRLRTGVRRDGTLVARDCEITLDGGAYADNGPFVARRIVTRILGGYRCPHLRVQVAEVYTNTVPAGSFRSIGGPQAAWATESHLDMIAERLGVDRLEIRFRNLVRPGESVRERMRPLDTDLARGLRRTAEAAGWGRPPAPGAGRGVALAVSNAGASPPAVALVRLHDDGSATVHESSTELGQGVRTVLAQIASEELSVPLGRVGVLASDTAATPYDRSTGASRSTTVMGLAVQAACREIRKQLLAIAAEQSGVKAGALTLKAGAVVTPSGKRHTFPELMRAFYESSGGELIGRGYIGAGFERGRLRQGPLFWEIGLGAAEAAVDRETGVVTLLRYVGAADVGRAINPALTESQEEGAAIQGLGHTLWESLIYEDGQLLNGSLLEYHVPVFGDIPEVFETLLFEDGNGPGPYRSKGMGEGGIGPVAPAVAGAVAQAIGVRITELPLTPERVWRALREASPAGPARERAAGERGRAPAATARREGT